MRTTADERREMREDAGIPALWNEIVIAVDVQRDFLTGSLAVPDAREIVHPLGRLVDRADVVIATADWHPPDHVSFAENGGDWPVHCVAGSAGAEVHPRIDYKAKVVVRKGSDSDAEAYSGFSGTPLKQIVKPFITDGRWLVICGLATDHCVKATVLDALSLGAQVVVPLDCCRGVDVETTRAAINEMTNRGAVILYDYDI